MKKTDFNLRTIQFKVFPFAECRFLPFFNLTYFLIEYWEFILIQGRRKVVDSGVALLYPFLKSGVAPGDTIY